MYTIKEIYKTIQGEGAQAGRTAVFVRFSGCNLWSGKEKHRASAVCKFVWHWKKKLNKKT